MTSNLRPEKRMDKNGRLVTKHVKDFDPSGTDARSLPAPALTVPSTPAKTVDIHELSNEDLMDSIEESLDKASYSLSSDQRKYLVDNGVFGYSMRRALESMYTATKGINAIEAESLMSGTTYFNTRKAEQGRNALEAAARAFPIARKVDAATFSSNHEYDRTRYEHYFGQFTKDFFGESLADHSPDKDDVDDLCSAYFLDRIGIEKSGYPGSTGAYYRALGKITSSREDIEPYLPILIASHLTDPDDYYYKGVDDVIWYVESLKNTVPVDKVEVVAREFLSRKHSSFDLAEEIVRNDSNAMMDGVL